MKKWLVAFASLLVLAGCEKPVEQIHLSGPTMGTTYNIKYIESEGIPSPEALQKEVDRLLEEVNDQMSTYRKDSELSRFNQNQTSTPFEVSPQTATVVKEAIRLNGLTLGALDVTVGPLVNLWGFGPEARPEVVPTDEELAARKANTGIQHLTVEGNLLTKDIPNLYVDLSTIAKGWGVDVVADYIQSQGIQNYMVEVGGEMRLKGVNREGVKWRIAIEKPSADERAVQEIIEPGDMAVATSGDYRIYFERDGVRYSHIINPQTGKPIRHKVVSVTVLDKSSMTADGLATGLMVLGEEQGMKIANENNIPVFMIVKTEDGFKEMASEAYKPFMNK
ncbi:thiamine biosynthesis lipoprotein [Vibrio coralliilyticus]|uniref:FAD:protein FMN transferase n=1 Tax=Vibrio coralliilyticus TaxID=190893 RepID=A0A7Y3YWC2_9VIBR|nr:MULTISPECIES: FAD:protein FMN transferase [Vibrio]MCM5508861.1 FAD:protein FMN transferase [Vibrio sp. SCSIO 43169]AIW19734.1 thiamine biosynthesis lipoprotein [Vibrio coralliilyticus]EEX34661.1 thiamin biosynthesis lipoprotein ApbE [Vibrio coralliilyticus ATCC BAA-450]KJY75523.1 thiamine biosynthesis lipoprotein [Vibrio coralliilyticus]MDE3897981.1 FAD:protein FMN transferase [Vibrio sp. CC007]